MRSYKLYILLIRNERPGETTQITYVTPQSVIPDILHRKLSLRFTAGPVPYNFEFNGYKFYK